MIADTFSSTPKLVVVDDIERAELSSKVLVGFINKFVEEEDCNVILLANEEKLEEGNIDFIELKEKIIGQTFLVRSEWKAAIPSFINKIKPQGLNGEQAIECVDLVFRDASHNLRAVKQAIYDYKRIYAAKPEFLETIDDIAFWLFLELLVYRVGLNTSRFTQSELLDSFKHPSELKILSRQHSSPSDYENDHIRSLDSAREKVESVVQGAFRAIGNSYSFTNFLTQGFISDFFCDGAINEKELVIAIKKSRHYGEEAPKWYPLVQYLYFDDDARFNQIYDSLWQEIESLDLMHPGDFLHVIGASLALNHENYGRSEAQILSISEHYIQKVRWSELDLSELIDKWDGISAWKGHQFTSYKTEAFKSICDLIKGKYSQLVSRTLENDITELPDKIRKNHVEALKEFYPQNGVNYKRDYHSQPVLCSLNVTEFILAILSLEPKSVLNAFGAFSRRYTENGNAANLIPELEMLKTMRSEVLKISESSDTGNLTRIRLNFVLEHYFVKALDAISN